MMELSSPDPNAALRSDIADLTAAVGELKASVDGLTAYGRRNRLLIRLAICSIAFDMALSLGLGWVAIRADQAAKTASSTARTTYTTCLSSNDARRVQTDLWSYVLESNPARDPAAAAKTEAFKGFIAKAFAQRDCEAIKR